jgi:hypothetical protein
MRSWVKRSLLGAILFAVIVAYLPGLKGPFVLDDAQNITLNESIALTSLDRDSLRTALSGNDSGIFRRPISALTFALNHYAVGGFGSSFAFKITNLAIHLANTLLIWFLCLALLDTPAAKKALRPKQRVVAALFVTALWALHPIQLTNVLYVVQRMNSLSAFWVLLGLLLYFYGRMRLPHDPVRGIGIMSLGAATGILLGTLSKENAVLWPLFALTTELTLFSPQRIAKKARAPLIAFHAALLGLMAATVIVLLFLQPDFVQQGYAGRSFSPLQRLLTESRVLWDYLFTLAVPDVRRLGLFHDDIVVSTGLFTPLTTLTALLALGAAIALAVIYRRRYPVAAFAFLWFLVGHSLESSVLGLELAYEHRNYLPSFGLLFGAVVLTTQLGTERPPLKRAVTVFLISAVLLVGIVTRNESSVWRDRSTLASELARRHPDSARANDFAARTSLFENKDLVAALRYTLRGIAAAPREAGFQIDLQILLAVLAQEIEKKPNHPALRTGRSGDFLKIPNLDTQFEISRSGKYLRLTHRHTGTALPGLLASEPISAHTIFSIEQLVACIETPESPCARLQDEALIWLTIANRNTNAARDYRAIVAADTAILYALRRDYSRAYDYMTQASKQLPGIATYDIKRTEYLIQLCAMDEALRLISDMQTKRTADAARLQELDRAARISCRPKK